MSALREAMNEASRQSLVAGLAENLSDVAWGSEAMSVVINQYLWGLSRTTAAVRGRALSGLTAAFFLGQFASPFYSLPLADWATIGGSFVITGYGLLALGAFFIALAVHGRTRRPRMPV